MCAQPRASVISERLSYHQSNEWFLLEHPRKDLLEKFYYLRSRFQNSCIYKGLDARTCARAGKSKRTLNKWLVKLYENGLCGKHKKKGHWMLMGNRVMDGRYAMFSPSPTKTVKHNCRLRLTNNCSILDVRKEIERALLEQKLRQIRFAVAKVNEDRPLTTDQALTGRKQHHQVLRSTRKHSMESRRGLGHVATNLSTLAEAMRTGRSTTSKRLKALETSGDLSILRRKRRVPSSYLEALHDPEKFQRTWGARYFMGKGGYCFINATSLYMELRNHSKPRVNAE